MTSSTIRSTSGSSAIRSPISPSEAIRTSWPSLRRFRRSPSAMERSSSMIRMQAMGSRGREHDAEGAAFAHARVQLDPAAVQLDDLAGDGEAQPGALGLAREQVVGAVEPLEDALSILGPHAGSVVLHLDGHAAGRLSRAQADALVVA